MTDGPAFGTRAPGALEGVEASATLGQARRGRRFTWGRLGSWFVFLLGVTYFVLRMAEDNFIIPQVVGHAVHLHPVLVLFAILAGGALAGPFGLLIGIPTVAVAQLLLRYLYRKLVDAPGLPPPEIKEPPSQPVPVMMPKPTEPPLMARSMRKRRS